MIDVHFQSSTWDVSGTEFWMMRPHAVFFTSKWIVQLDWTLGEERNECCILSTGILLVFALLKFVVILLRQSNEWGLNGCSLHLKWDLKALPLGVGWARLDSFCLAWLFLLWYNVWQGQSLESWMIYFMSRFPQSNGSTFNQMSDLKCWSDET